MAEKEKRIVKILMFIKGQLTVTLAIQLSMDLMTLTTMHIL